MSEGEHVVYVWFISFNIVLSSTHYSANDKDGIVLNVVCVYHIFFTIY